MRELNNGSNILLESKNIIETINLVIREINRKIPILLKDEAIIIWDIKKNYNAFVTLTASRTLELQNVEKGDYGTLKIIQGGAGSYTLTLPVGSKVGNTGAGVITLSTVVGKYDIITFYKDELGVLNFNITSDFT